MTPEIESIVGEYEGGTLDWRAFLGRLVATTGSMATAHLLLESSGLTSTLVSETGSRQAKVASETMKYPSTGNVSVSGYLSAPPDEGKYPAVIVIHENRGLNDHTRDVARRFAAEGFVALAPDLLSRKGGTGSIESPDKAREAITSLAPEDAIADMRGIRRLCRLKGQNGCGIRLVDNW